VKKLNVSKLADPEMQTVLMAHMETNMMNLSYNGTINDQWENLCKKMYETSGALAEVILPESQCGYRRSRSTIDMIFTLR